MESFTPETFEGRVGERFRIAFDDERPAEAELLAVTPLGEAAIGRRAPFSLLFRAAGPATYEQRIYAVEHDELGSFELFLVPVAEGEYEAVFA